MPLYTIIWLFEFQEPGIDNLSELTPIIRLLSLQNVGVPLALPSIIDGWQHGTLSLQKVLVMDL